MRTNEKKGGHNRNFLLLLFYFVCLQYCNYPVIYRLISFISHLQPIYIHTDTHMCVSVCDCDNDVIIYNDDDYYLLMIFLQFN